MLVTLYFTDMELYQDSDPGMAAKDCQWLQREACVETGGKFSLACKMKRCGDKLFAKTRSFTSRWWWIRKGNPIWSAFSLGKGRGPWKAKVAQLCPTLCDPMHFSPPGSSVHAILQARILEWVAVPFSRGSSQSRDQTQVSHIAGRFFTICITTESTMMPFYM